MDQYWGARFARPTGIACPCARLRRCSVVPATHSIVRVRVNGGACPTQASRASSETQTIATFFQDRAESEKRLRSRSSQLAMPQTRVGGGDSNPRPNAVCLVSWHQINTTELEMKGPQGARNISFGTLTMIVNLVVATSGGVNGNRARMKGGGDDTGAMIATREAFRVPWRDTYA